MNNLVDQLRATCLPPPAERRAIRRRAKARLEDIAKAVGVDPMTVSRWERGLSEPWPKNRDDYLRVLDALRTYAHELEAKQNQK